MATSNNLSNNITYLKTSKSNKFYSSRLLNYVEPVEISGYKKTVFYSEINTNLNVDDRIFIVNGNYDSDNYISLDKYTKYTDGYRVLGVDGCRIILDLDYTGVMPYEEADINTFILVHHVTSQREFDYINSIVVGLTYSTVGTSGVYSKFNGYIVGNTASLYTNDIIYSDGLFIGSTHSENKNTGVTSSGFFVRHDFSSATSSWVNITNNILNDSISSLSSDFINIGKLLIIGEDITHNGATYKQRNAYKYEDGAWTIDISYKKPMLSKLNFRYGKFKGKHNDGIFGTNLKSNNWDNATWNSGIFVDSNWNSGTMNSKSSVGEKLYYTQLKTSSGSTQSLPVQTIDLSNNKGFGYNIVLDSNINSGEIVDGNFENCNIGTPATFSAIDVYYGLTQSFDLTINGGQYSLCDINSIISNNSILTNCEIKNSNLYESKIVNSQVYDSTAGSGSEFNANSGIQILAADLWSRYRLPGTASWTFGDFMPTVVETFELITGWYENLSGILKLYISDSDLLKFNTGDSFYISKINKDYVLSSLDDQQKVILPVETKYIFDLYFDNELSSSSSKLTVTIKSKNDNKWKTTADWSFGSYPISNLFNILTPNIYNYASIDIDCSSFGWFQSSITGTNQYYYTSSYNLTPITLENVNNVFMNTYLHDADFKSGLFNNSKWISGDNKNYQQNIINSSDYITYNGGDILVLLPYNKMNTEIDIPGQDVFIGDTVWLNSIDQTSGLTTSSIQGRYIVDSLTYSTSIVTVGLLPQDVTLISASYSSSTANYVSINKFLIDSSIINSGVFKRTGIKRTIFENKEFDITDRNLTLSNIDKLKLININFKDTLNVINDGLIYKSHFINDTWNNGVAFNSVWNGGTFSNGVFKAGYWIDGTFNNGSFIDSNDLVYSSPDYDDLVSFKFKNWVNGTFNLGEFYNSAWAGGTFNNGRFYNSDWYGGIWNNGILGSNTIPTSNTSFSTGDKLSADIGYIYEISSATYSVWNNGIVENAKVGGKGLVYWNGGKFNNGEFTSYGSSLTQSSIWYDGEFNGGSFTGLAKWKNGTFNKGKFLSYYGYELASPTNSSTYSTDYGWENGKFKGGEFGNSSTATNSVWYNGVFSGGVFSGRLWYNGIFNKGSFIGSGLTGGSYSIYNSPDSSIYEFNFADSFTNSYYGLWYNGFVADVVHNVKTDERVYTELVRKVDEKRTTNEVILSNILWLNGTFSHETGIIQNSLWLNGDFVNGSFDSGVFNAYVDRDFTGSFSNSSFASTQSSVWENGEFDSTYGNSSFYVSDWKAGTFNDGYMSGATWRNGVWNYGTAENIYWENGLWRNGTWNGTPFDYNSISTWTSSLPLTVLSGRPLDILVNVSRSIGTSSMHIINAFSASTTPVNVLTDVNVTSLNETGSSWDFSSATYSGIISWVGYTPNYGSLNTSTWSMASGFTVSSTATYSDSNAYTKGGQLNAVAPYGHGRPTTPGYNSPRLSDVAPSSKLYAYNGSTTSVFSANKTYNISLDIAVELIQTVVVEFGIGASILSLTFSSYKDTAGGLLNYWPNVYNVNFTYNTTPDSVGLTDSNNHIIGNELYIRKTSGGILRLLRGQVTDQEVEYHNTYNNTLYNGISGTSASFPNDPHLISIATSDDGNLVSMNFGNGVFRSGIWENGVWNNGYRSGDWFNEPDYYRMSDVIGIGGKQPNTNQTTTYKIDDQSWIITLSVIDDLSGLSIGDKVSIGNIVAIDVNENRRIIKDYYRVSSIDSVNNTLSVNLVTNFPIRRVERDSTNHVIYVTKNIWLSGAFLNGYFKGIWNNGLMKGYPMITEIEDTEWVSGTFDGGHFISNFVLADTMNSIPSYNTSVIQNLIFNDNNIAQVNQCKYLSWMDVNYSTDSRTNLNRDSTLYSEVDAFASGVTVSFVANPSNLYGYPTFDILNSVSSFRDSFSTNINSYKLGTKYTKYDNSIPNDGDFTRPVSNTLLVGMDNFTNDGWIYYDFNSYIDSGDTDTHFKFSSNVGLDTSGKIRISATGSIQYASNSYSEIRIYNTNIVTEKNRYYISELDIESITMNGTSDRNYILLNDDRTVPVFNHYFTNNLKKVEYFYNKQNLDLTIESVASSSTASVAIVDSYFNNISFTEVDMIPFFQYATESSIDMRIKTPLKAIAPYIDYNNANFDFIGNINLTFDSQGILSQQVTSNQSSVSIGSTVSVTGGSVPLPNVLPALR